MFFEKKFFISNSRIFRKAEKYPWEFLSINPFIYIDSASSKAVAAWFGSLSQDNATAEMNFVKKGISNFTIKKKQFTRSSYLLFPLTVLFYLYFIKSIVKRTFFEKKNPPKQIKG